MCRRIISVPDTCGLVISVTLFYNLMRETHLEIITEDPGVFLGFSGGSDSKESACNAGELGSILGLERSPGGGHGNPLQCSCLENPWTEEPGGLQFMGSQRVRHDRVMKHTLLSSLARGRFEVQDPSGPAL